MDFGRRMPACVMPSPTLMPKPVFGTRGGIRKLTELSLQERLRHATTTQYASRKGFSQVTNHLKQMTK